ncbi:MAG: C13 family peptidase [Polaromonas sp.]
MTAWHDARMNLKNASADQQPSPAATFLPIKDWLVEGFRAGFFLPPRTAGRSPSPLQVLLIFVIYFALEVALSRLVFVGSARFDAQAWLSGWWSLLVFVGMAWWAFSAPESNLLNSSKSSRVAACFSLSLLAAIPSVVFYELLMAALAHRLIKPTAQSAAGVYWSIYGIFMFWSFGVLILLIRRFSGWTVKTAVFVAAMMACTAMSIWQFDQRAWQEDYSSQAKADADKPRLRLSQQTFEAQQALWTSKVNALAPQRDGITDVYGLVFAPYATEDVFKRESTLVADILSQRFDAKGRVLHLLNHGATSPSHLWAAPQNAERAIQALAERMDKDNDVLVVYLTSHGGSDFKLAASHWPLDVEPLTPQLLRAALDKAGIRNRVITVSACYSGGWVAPLANDNTLVMTAADATHTSYGCGRLSELTYFGRALFDEQLRKTRSFEQAFTNAVPLIKQREIDAGKDDGFSNPQISVGSSIRPLLKSLEQWLDALPQTPSTAPESPASR